MSVLKSHGRVERARQKLVNAEEAYLRAHGWQRLLLGNGWMWSKTAANNKEMIIILSRSDAVTVQHTNYGDS